MNEIKSPVFPPIEKVQELAHSSGVGLKEYVDENLIKPFSGGKLA